MRGIASLGVVKFEILLFAGVGVVWCDRVSYIFLSLQCEFHIYISVKFSRERGIQDNVTPPPPIPPLDPRMEQM